MCLSLVSKTENIAGPGCARLKFVKIYKAPEFVGLIGVAKSEENKTFDNFATMGDCVAGKITAFPLYPC